jgi:glycine/D-amino acid oxidase-like deaminating enzyme
VRVAVVGVGVVGLATAACLVRDGVEVVCFERSAVVMGERSAGSSRIFRLAHVDADLVRLAEAARRGFARWGAGIVDPVGCVVSGGDAAERARAMAAVGVPHELRDTADDLRLPVAGPVTGPVLVDPGGGVVDVDAVRALLVGVAGSTVAHAEVEGIAGGGAAAGGVGRVAAVIRVGGGTHRFDAVVLAAGASTAALAADVGIDLPSALQHHARFTFPLPDGPRPAWIDVPQAGLRTYQHRSGPGRWSVGGTVDSAAVAWDVGPDAATAASREILLGYARDRLTVTPEVVETLYCTHAPDTGDGITFGRSGAVLAVWGENLMKFAPVLGESLAAAAVDGSTPSVRELVEA